MTSPLLAVRGLDIVIRARPHQAEILRAIDLSILEGEIHGLVGESGSGKTTLARALMRLLSPPCRRARGEILFGGLDLCLLPEKEMRHLRGATIAYVPQDAASALNPHQKVGSQFVETLRAHQSVTASQAREQAIQSLAQVGLEEGNEILRSYAHELSVGMAQRVLIAMALALRPRLLLADEPTSSLDVVASVRVARLLADLNERSGLTILFITHDLEMLFRVAHRITVLYGGEIMEQGSLEEIKSNPSHPYTQALLAARLLPGETPLAISGEPPEPGARPQGCVFHPRCPEAGEECSQGSPGVEVIASDHSVRCFHRSPSTREETT
ncbi:MAG TPA: ABC transporter ATP-binding protein [Acidobacteriota bacterium]|nr:ABC transporter ATP-binding protein [Acidobacteriota bacterium]